MTASVGPRALKDGLIFAYDIANTEKSWKGAPTTNYFTSVPPAYDLWNSPANATVTNSGVARVLTAGDAGTTYMLEGLGNPGGLLDTNVAVSYSAYLRGSGTARIRADQSNSTPGQTASSRTSAPVTLDPVIWQRAKVEGYYPQLNPTVQNVLVYITSGSEYVEVKDVQWEYQPFATPRTASSRTTTNNVIDMTNRSTVTVGANFTYTAENKIKFEPGETSANGLSIPLDTAFNKQEGTLDIWAKADTFSGSNGLFVNRNSATANALDWLWFGFWSSAGFLYLRIGDSVACCVQQLAPSAHGVVAGQYAHLVATWKASGNMVIYINGELLASRSTGTIPATNPASTGLIGIGHATTGSGAFDGEIAKVNIYNRQLTAAEVKQNFKAHRGRFGI